MYYYTNNVFPRMENITAKELPAIAHQSPLIISAVPSALEKVGSVEIVVVN